MLHTSRAHEHQLEVTLRRTSRISVRRGDTINAPISFRSCRQCDGIALVEACR
jgi:hypothetical protein